MKKSSKSSRSSKLGRKEKSGKKRKNEKVSRRESRRAGEARRASRAEARAYEAYSVRGGRRHIPESLRSYITGIVDMKSSGKAYILPDNKEIEDVFIGANSVGHALHGDHVRVMIFPSRSGHRLEGQIVEILERKKTNLVGTIEFAGKQAYLVPDSANVHVNLVIPKENLSGAKAGQKVVAKITEWPPHLKNPVGEVIAVLGKPGDNNVEMQSILAEFDFPLTYPEDAVAAAANLNGKITAKEVAQRRDFRKVYTCTIDPVDAKDFDDALSFRVLENGNFEIGIHIADVSYFVKPGSAIDNEAYARATSVYLVDRTIPMLPERLCNDLCSLNPGVDRYSFSCVFEMDAEAKIKNFWIGKGVIHSDHRYTYEEAQSILEAAGLVSGTAPDSKALQGMGTEQEIEAMCQMFRISKILRDKRFRTGAINFHSQEVRFRLDPVTAKPLGVYIKESKESNHLVEEFMLLANRRVAEVIGKNMKVVPKDHGIYGTESSNRVRGFDKEMEAAREEGKQPDAKTFVYRVHDEPNPDKLANFSQFVGKLGYKLSLGSRSGLVKSFNRLLSDVEGKAEQNMIETIAVRTMAKAYYSTHNIGHYGLAFPFYTHFTSPIRRYPDLMVHRLLEFYIVGGESVDAGPFESRCEHSSEMEKKAADAERASVKYKQAEFMLDKIGQHFFGTVSGVSKWGIYVSLDENYCEGLVPMRSMQDDFYELDEENYQVIGLRTGHVYKLGQRVEIVVQEIDLNKKQLTFCFPK